MKSILFLLVLIIFYSCKKNKKETTCPQQNYYNISNIINNFNFKKNSYWILKSSTTNTKDTLKVYYNSGITENINFGTSKECSKGDVYYNYHISLYHNIFPSNYSIMEFSGANNELTSSYYRYCPCNQLSFFDKNIGDSITFNNNNNWSKIEAIYSSIIINGHTYYNVYQMYYYPDLYDFKRIWWCPGIGFVKFELYNTNLNQTEYWELDSYNVQLY